VEAILIVRLVKFLAVGAFFAGALGVLIPDRLEDRKRTAYFIAGRDGRRGWISGSLIALSLVAISALMVWRPSL